jgi:chromosome segregation ATPase
MATTMTLGNFYSYIRNNRKRIADIYREIEEIQYQFNDLHARLLQGRQKLIDTYVPLLLKTDDLPADLAQLLATQEKVERDALQKEISALEEETTLKRQKADQLIKQAQEQIAQLRQQNPILNEQEEQLKARRASIEREIQRLDNELKRLGCFPIGWLTNYFRRRRLLTQRRKLAENLEAINRGIRAVRAKWQEEKKRLQESQAELQRQWQALSVEVAQLQARLDDLTANIEEYSKQRAARNWLSNLQDLPATDEPWRERLAPLVELNRKKVQYEAGLTSVAEILGLLKGLGEGMDRFIRSVATVYEEQQRYKLPELRLNLSDAVTSFHAIWPDFQAKVKDEKYLGAHPLEFSQRIKEVVQQKLHESAIQKMFEDMGNALTEATKAWR